MTNTYNESIEAHVLSCLLKDASLFPLVEDILDEKSFGWPAFGIIYKSIKDLVNADLYPDRILIQTDLERKNLLNGISVMSAGVKGEDVLRWLESLDSDSGNIESYAFQVVEMKGIRQIITLADKMKTLASEGKRPFDILSTMDSESGKIAAHIGMQSKNNRNAKQVALENISQLEEVIAGKNLYISSGLNSWDSFLGGLFPGRLYLVAARANEGKTSLGLNIALHVAEKEKKDVKIFTFESKAEEVQNKIIQMKTGISSIRIERGEMTKDEIEKYKSALREISELPLSYDDSSELPLSLLRAKIRKAVGEGAKLIIIDQLEQVLIGGAGDSQPEYIKVNYIAYRIKAFAREMNVPIILIHQLNRKGESPENRNKVIDPVLSDLSQAGEKAPDAVIMLRTTMYPRLFYVKNRQGAKGSSPVNWDGPRTKFSDTDEEKNSKPDFVQETYIEEDE